MRPSPKALRVVLGLGAGGLTAAATVAAGGMIFLFSERGAAWVSEELIATTHALYPQTTLAVGGLEIGWSDGLTIQDLRFTMRDGSPLLEMENTEVRWRLMDLLKRRVTIEDITLSDTTVYISSNDGTVNWIQALELDSEEETEPWEGLPIPLSIASFALLDTTVVTTIDELQNTTAITELKSRVNVTGTEVTVQALELTGSTEALQPGGQTLGIGASLAQYRMEDTEHRIEQLELSVGDTKIHLQGDADLNEGAPSIDMKMEAPEVQLSAIESWLNTSLDIKDGFDLQGAIEGSPDQPRATLSLLTAAGTLHTEATINLAIPEPEWTVEGKINGLQVSDLLLAVEPLTTLEGKFSFEGSGTTWPDAIRGAGSVELTDSTVWDEPVDRVVAALRVEAGRVFIDPLTIESPLATGALTGWIEPEPLAGEVDAALKSIRLAPLSGYAGERLSGTAAFEGRLSIRTQDDALQADGTGELRLMSAGIGSDIKLAKARLPTELVWAPTGLSASGNIEARQIDTYGATTRGVQGEWHVSMPTGEPLAFTAAVGAGGLGYGPIDMEALDLDIQGNVAEGGDPNVTLNWTGTSLALAPEGGTPVRSNLTDGSLELSEGSALIEINGRNGAEQVIGIDAIHSLNSNKGQVSALLLTGPDGLVIANNAPIRYALQEEGGASVEADILIGEGAIRIDGLWAEVDNTEIDVAIESVDLARLLPLWDESLQGVQGVVNAKVKVNGTGEALNADATSELRAFKWPGVIKAMHASATLNTRQDGLGLTVDIRKARKPLFSGNATLPVTLYPDGATLDGDAPWQLALNLAPATSDLWKKVLDIEGIDVPASAFSASFEATGTPRKPTTRFAGVVESVTGADGQLLRFEWDVQQNDDNAHLNGVLRAGFDPRVTLTGNSTVAVHHIADAILEGLPTGDLAVPATWVSNASLKVAADQLSLDSVRGLIDLPRVITGEASGDFVFSNYPEAPTIQGRFELHDGAVGNVPIEDSHFALLPQEAGYDLDLRMGFGLAQRPEQEGLFSFASAPESTADPGWVEISGFIPVAWTNDGLDITQPGTNLKIKGPGIPLGAISAAVGEESYATGLLALSGSVRGSLERPRPKLKGKIDGGTIDWNMSGVRYEDIHLDLVFNKRRVALNRFHVNSKRLQRSVNELSTAKTETGTADIEGTAKLDGWELQAVDLAVQLDHFWLAGLAEATMVASGQFGATGVWPALKIEGQMMVHDAFLEAEEDLWLSHGSLEIDPMITINRATRKTKRVSVLEEDEWWDQMRIAVTTDLNNSVGFLGRMPLDDRFGALYASLTTITIEVDLDGEVESQINAGEISVIGEVETLGGKAQIFGAEFEINTGTIAFTGGDPENPIMNLTAEHNAGEYGVITARIGGTPEVPELTLTSDEYPEDADVASILMFGAPLSEMSDSQGQNNAFLLALAMNSLAGNVERSLGSKLWDIETNESGAIDAVRVGFSLGDDVFLMLGVNPDAEEDENIREATVEWAISPQLQAEVMTGDRNIGSADLFWTWRF